MMSTHETNGTRYISLGQHRENKRVNRHQINNLQDFIKTTSELTEFEHSLCCATFRNDERCTKNFEALHLIAVDVDHFRISKEEKFLIAIHPPWEKIFPCSAFHPTPHGVRFFFLLDHAITDLKLAQKLLLEMATLFQQDLVQANLHLEYKVDGPASKDVARFYWAPNALVDGLQRCAPYTILREEPWSLEQILVLLREVTPEVEAPSSKPLDKNSPASRWKLAHPIDWESFGGICPICEHKKCFGPCPKSEGMAGYCFSSNHKEDAKFPHIGKLGTIGYIIDALDLEANKRGTSVTEVLETDGYVSPKLELNTSGEEDEISVDDQMEFFDSVKEEEIEWIWDDRISLGEIYLVAGPPGIGKSTVVTRALADLSRGANLPGHKGAPKVYRTAIVAIEDRAERVILPRLKAAGANLSNICYMNESKRRFDPTNKKRMAEFEAFLIKKDIKILVVDSLGKIFSGKDVNSYADCYEILNPFAQLANRLNVAVIITYHTKKSKETTALDSVLGSRALTAAVRGVLVVENTQEEGVKAIGVAKMNHAAQAPTIAFTLNKTDKSVFAMWKGEIPDSSDDIASGSSKSRNIQAGVKWLQEHFSDGLPRKPSDVEKAFKADSDKDVTVGWDFVRQNCFPKSGLIREGQSSAKVWKKAT